MKTFILKRLKEELLVNESFDKPLSNIEKVDDFEYNVSEDDIKAKILFRLEVNNDSFTDFPTIKSESIINYYEASWRFTDDTPQTTYNWRRVTATLFKVLDDFIRIINPDLLVFSSRKKTGKVYFHSEFENKLTSLFPNFYILPYKNKDTVFLVKRHLTHLKERVIKKELEYCNTITLEECVKIYHYPHKNKHLFKGITRNDLRKEQLERIKNKLRYLF